MVNMVTDAYLKRGKLGKEGNRTLYRNLITILANKKTSATTIASFDNLDRVILYVALNQLRESIAMHIRGTRLNYAPKLENLLTFFKKSLECSKLKEPNSTLAVKHAKVSVFNDDNVTQKDFLRQHMLHCNMEFVASFYSGQSNISWVKKGWSGDDVTDILAKADSAKRRLRHTIFNDESTIDFEPPIFDNDKKLFNRNLKKANAYDTTKPLIPSADNEKTLII